MRKVLTIAALALAVGLAQLPKPGEPASIPESLRTRSVALSLGGDAIDTGSQGFAVVEYPCTIDQWTVAADASGSIVVDVKRATYANFPTTTSIVGGSGNKPTLSSAQKNQAAPSSWTSLALAAGDVIEFNVDSVTTVTKVAVSLRCIVE